MKYLHRLLTDFKHTETISFLLHDSIKIKKLIETGIKLYSKYDFDIFPLTGRPEIESIIKYGVEENSPVYKLGIKLLLKYGKIRQLIRTLMLYPKRYIPIEYAAIYGKTKLFNWIVNFLRINKYSFDEESINFPHLMDVASGGHIECMKLLHKWGKPTYIRGLAMEIASSGHPKCMKLLHKWKAPIDTRAMTNAVMGHPRCMKLLHKWEAPINEDDLYNAFSWHPRCMKLIYKWDIQIDYVEAVLAAIFSESIVCIKLLHKWNIPMTDNKILEMAKYRPEIAKLFQEWRIM